MKKTPEVERAAPPGKLTGFPPPEKWDDWVEYDPKRWPEKVARHYSIVPTVCFNCEAACGLLAYVDKESLEVRKFEGNPLHPGSRGKNCAKGPATINQVKDPERILYPLRRQGSRGEGKWARVSWDEALNDIAARIRRAPQEGRKNEVMYHVGRPGHERYMERVLRAWGVDGHNSHTTICSAGARLGFALWSGYDRPSPDHSHARFILLLSAHLESGHYFTPHAQRILEGKLKGAKLAVMDPRLSNTASVADYWLPTWPGSEAAVLLAMARVLLVEDLYDAEFLRRWTNWETYSRAEHGDSHPSFETFVERLKEVYAEFTPEFAEEESGVPAKRIVEVARAIGEARGKFASHLWRNAASGNLGGWQVARALQLLTVLSGSVGTKGGTLPHAWNKFKPKLPSEPPLQEQWNELLFPREYPLSHYEMSILLPHYLREGRGKLDVYFTRVYNPVWTNPDGQSWINVLEDESTIGLHVALTPTWNETSYFADYVLPMGLGGERHDIQSTETHAGVWVSFRQPVVRAAMERMGRRVDNTYEANPGEVWEEDEFWNELSWRIDPDGSMGIRQHFESPYRPGEKITVDEYYQHIFESSVPGLADKAQEEGLSALEYMKKYGAFEIKSSVYELHEKKLTAEDLEGAQTESETGRILKGGKAVGIMVDGEPLHGFNTPSKKLEIYSETLKQWGWPEYVLPGYIRSQVHRSSINRDQGEFALVPTFRLPTLIHTRSANAKWLNEIAHRNPIWMNPQDAARLGVRSGDLLRVSTAVGYMVNRVWETDSMVPGVIACSHHLGRWRINDEEGSRWASPRVRFQQTDDGVLLRQIEPHAPFKSSDRDTERIWWSDGGVHQNLTFPVQPDPVSGNNCWHQKVKVERAWKADRYGDVFVNPGRAREVLREWLAKTRPATGRMRRPEWLDRPFRPTSEAFRFEKP
jgi:anaerobic selenocysteine-containing dehydrogenase